MRLISKKAMLIGPWLLLAPKATLTPVDENHEEIHSKQQSELLIIFFWLWYGVEYLIRLIQYRENKAAYRNISFEREAYINQSNLDYIKTRTFWAHLNYLKHEKYK